MGKWMILLRELWIEVLRHVKFGSDRILRTFFQSTFRFIYINWITCNWIPHKIIYVLCFQSRLIVLNCIRGSSFIIKIRLNRNSILSFVLYFNHVYHRGQQKSKIFPDKYFSLINCDRSLIYLSHPQITTSDWASST